VQPVAQAAAPIVQPVAQAAAPVLAAVEPVVQAAAPVLVAAQPILVAAQPVLDAGAPILEATSPLLESTGPLLESSAPLLGSTGPLSSSTRQILSSGSSPGTPQTGIAATPGSSLPASAPAAAETAAPLITPVAATTPSGVPVSGDPVTVAVAPSTRDRRPVFRAGRDATPTIGYATGMEYSAATPAASTDGQRARTAKAVSPDRPAPNVPSGPIGFLAAISAAFASSAALLFVAALAAVFLLVAPGLGRRLRPRLASRPLPIYLISLERPG
jgi:hypothetical protein